MSNTKETVTDSVKDPNRTGDEFEPNIGNDPVVSDEDHTGIANKASYEITVDNAVKYSDTSNTVTVAPNETELNVSKKWDLAGDDDYWPRDTTVTFGIFYVDENGNEKPYMVNANTQYTVTLDITKPKATVKGLPALSKGAYVAREIKVNDKDVAHNAQSNGGIVKLNESLEYFVKLAKLASDGGEPYVKLVGILPAGDRLARGIEGPSRLFALTTNGDYYATDLNDKEGNTWKRLDPVTDANLWSNADQRFNGYGPNYANNVKEFRLYDEFEALNSTTNIEKYVNDNVHADIVEFNKEFEYDIMAYVPAGATAVELYDNLTGQLQLNSTADEIKNSVVVKDTNDHTVESSVAVTGNALPADIVVTPTVSGKSVTVRFADDTTTDAVNELAAIEGKWIQITIKATIDPAAYNSVAEKVESGNDATDADINWENVASDGNVLGGVDPHAGLANKATMKVEVGNQSSSIYESNHVTVKPETVQLDAQKSWETAADDGSGMATLQLAADGGKGTLREETAH